MANLFRILMLLVFVVTAGLTAGCSQKEGVPGAKQAQPPALTAHTLGEQSIFSNAEHLVSGEYAVADVAKGERLAMQCRACHSLEAGGVNMIGPALYGFFGKRAGSRADFSYSSALANTRFIWTPRSLDAWLTQPARFLPGNRMVYVGLSKADDRRALIAYLLNVTDDTAKE